VALFLTGRTEFVGSVAVDFVGAVAVDDDYFAIAFPAARTASIKIAPRPCREYGSSR
jgi:hypothetical protein